MKHFREDPYDDSMTDAEFFKLMGVENMTDASKKYPLEIETVLPQLQGRQSNSRVLKTWLPVAALATLIVFLFA